MISSWRQDSRLIAKTFTRFERKDGTMNQPIYDLQHRIQEALAEINDLRGSRVEVVDSNGIITLTGTVPTVEARERAEAIVRGMEGVTSVINELNVI
jgi:osmotically-inducible protein OsmY